MSKERAKEIISGTLSKCDKRGYNWKTRHVVFTDLATIEYYKDAKDQKPQGVVDMDGYTAQLDPVLASKKGKPAFSITKSGERTYWFLAGTINIAKKWVETINTANSDDGKALRTVRQGIISGTLLKCGENMKNFKQRFVVYTELDTLEYFENDYDSVPIGTVGMDGYSASVDTTLAAKRAKPILCLTKEGARTYWFQTETEDECEEWIAAINNAHGGATDGPGHFEERRSHWRIWGTVQKADENQSNWKSRHVVVTDIGTLEYFRNSFDVVPLGVVVLEGYTAYLDLSLSASKGKSAFRIVKPGARTYWFLCEDDVEQWLSAICDCTQTEMSCVKVDGVLSNRSTLHSLDVSFSEGKLRNRKSQLLIDTEAGTVTDVPFKGASCHLAVSQVYRLHDPCKLVLSFTDGTFSIPVSNEITVPSPQDRERAFLLLHALQLQPKKVPADVKIFAGSWNMGDAQGPDDLSAFLPRGHDVYAVGVQECEYKPADGQSCGAHFFKTVTNTLGEGYTLLESVSLMSIRLVVVVRTALCLSIHNVSKGTVATGIGGVVGNKGGCAVAFDLDETSFLFISSHLAARQEETLKRNADYSDIIKGFTWLGRKCPDVTDSYSHCIWIGDLNYRIDLPRAQVISHIAAEEWEPLFAADQLAQEMAAERVFCGFEEGPCNFKPTYRFERGNREWSEEKMRIPSWCDRSVSRSMPNRAIARTAFAPCHEVMTSDHSPVYATYDVLCCVPHDPIANPSTQAFEVVVEQLAATDLKQLKEDSISSPCVEFVADFLDLARTNGGGRFLDVEWSQEMRLPVSPLLSAREYLREQVVVLVLRDDSSSGYLGQCLLPLKDAVEDTPFEFSLRFRRHGLFVGNLRGRVHVVPK